MASPIQYRVVSRTDTEHVSGSTVTTRINTVLAVGDTPNTGSMGPMLGMSLSLSDLTEEQFESVTHDLVDLYIVPRGMVATFTTGSN